MAHLNKRKTLTKIRIRSHISINKTKYLEFKARRTFIDSSKNEK